VLGSPVAFAAVGAGAALGVALPMDVTFGGALSPFLRAATAAPTATPMAKRQYRAKNSRTTLGGFLVGELVVG
jgi:hypothetical protein